MAFSRDYIKKMNKSTPRGVPMGGEARRAAAAAAGTVQPKPWATVTPSWGGGAPAGAPRPQFGNAQTTPQALGGVGIPNALGDIFRRRLRERLNQFRSNDSTGRASMNAPIGGK